MAADPAEAEAHHAPRVADQNPNPHPDLPPNPPSLQEVEVIRVLQAAALRGLRAVAARVLQAGMLHGRREAAVRVLRVVTYRVLQVAAVRAPRVGTLLRVPRVVAVHGHQAATFRGHHNNPAVAACPATWRNVLPPEIVRPVAARRSFRQATGPRSPRAAMPVTSPATARPSNHLGPAEPLVPEAALPTVLRSSPADRQDHAQAPATWATSSASRAVSREVQRSGMPLPIVTVPRNFLRIGPAMPGGPADPVV